MSGIQVLSSCSSLSQLHSSLCKHWFLFLHSSSLCREGVHFWMSAESQFLFTSHSLLKNCFGGLYIFSGIFLSTFLLFPFLHKCRLTLLKWRHQDLLVRDHFTCSPSSTHPKKIHSKVVWKIYRLFFIEFTPCVVLHHTWYRESAAETLAPIFHFLNLL